MDCLAKKNSFCEYRIGCSYHRDKNYPISFTRGIQTIKNPFIDFMENHKKSLAQNQPIPNIVEFRNLFDYHVESLIHKLERETGNNQSQYRNSLLLTKETGKTLCCLANDRAVNELLFQKNIITPELWELQLYNDKGIKIKEEHLLGACLNRRYIQIKLQENLKPIPIVNIIGTLIHEITHCDIMEHGIQFCQKEDENRKIFKNLLPVWKRNFGWQKRNQDCSAVLKDEYEDFEEHTGHHLINNNTSLIQKHRNAVKLYLQGIESPRRLRQIYEN